MKSRYVIPTVFPDEPDLGALHKRICGFQLNCLCHILFDKIFPFKRDRVLFRVLTDRCRLDAQIEGWLRIPVSKQGPHVGLSQIHVRCLVQSLWTQDWRQIPQKVTSLSSSSRKAFQLWQADGWPCSKMVTDKCCRIITYRCLYIL